MSSRMDKYKDKMEPSDSRTARNQNIYSRVEDKDLESLNLRSNVSIIEADPNSLDIDKLRELLDDKYQSKRSTPIIPDDLVEDESLNDIDLETTKEYNLKKILEEAHKNKDTDYDRERFKKLRETQYDILSSLNIGAETQEEPTETLTTEEANLMNLIKTVDFNAAKNRASKVDSDDLFGDLIGSGNTEVLEPITFDEPKEPDKKSSLKEELEKTKKISRHELDEEINKYETSEERLERTLELDPLTKTQEMANSFYTGKFQINDEDMDDFADLEREMKGGSLIIKILIIILVLIVLGVGVFLLNKYLNLGLF